MPTIQPTGTASTTGATPASGASSTLGKDDFLKLLVGQLKYQNPLQPKGDQEFISQMTQYSILEQITNLAGATERLTGAAATGQAVNLIGKTVTYADASGAPQTGVVESVTLDRGTPTLTVGGQAGIDPAKVTEVR